MTQNEPWTSSCISAKLELCIYHGSQNSILTIITFTTSESVPTKLEIINEVHACMPKTGTVALALQYEEVCGALSSATFGRANVKAPGARLSHGMTIMQDIVQS